MLSFKKNLYIAYIRFFMIFLNKTVKAEEVTSQNLIKKKKGVTLIISKYLFLSYNFFNIYIYI